MIRVDFSRDIGVWRLMDAKGLDRSDRLSVVHEGMEDQPCLRTAIEFSETNQSYALVRTQRIDRPRTLHFRYRWTGTADLPLPKIRVQMVGGPRRRSINFLPRTTYALRGWFKADVSMEHPEPGGTRNLKGLVNIWGFYGSREIETLTLLIEGSEKIGRGVLLVDGLEFRYADPAVENYVPCPVAPRPHAGTRIAVALHNAGDRYRLKENLETVLPDAELSVHPFRGLHLSLDAWPSSLADVDLVVLGDVDSYVFSDSALLHLANYLHGGGKLLVVLGPNSLVFSIDGRGLFEQLLPVETVGPTRSESGTMPKIPDGSPLQGLVAVERLGLAGPMQSLCAKQGAPIILEAGDGVPLLVAWSVGKGTVTLLNTWADPTAVNRRSLFTLGGYDALIRWTVARLLDREWSFSTPQPEPLALLRIRLPFGKRAFQPGYAMNFTVVPMKEFHPEGVEAFILNEIGKAVASLSGARSPDGTWAFQWNAPDLREGDYRLRAVAKHGETEVSVEEDIAVVPPLHTRGWLPIIGCAKVSCGGHYHSREGLRRMIDDLAAHGINVVAVPLLSRIVEDPDGYDAQLVGWLEYYAQRQAMAVMYGYADFCVHSQGKAPPIDIYAEDAVQRARQHLVPQMAVADAVPSLWSVKTIDEPFANWGSLGDGEATARAFQARCGRPLPSEDEIERLPDVDRLAYYRFLSETVKRRFDVGHAVFRKQTRPWGLLHTFMEPGFGNSALHFPRFEDVYAWADSAEFIDFDIYPYWYVESTKLRFAKVHYGFAFIRGIAHFYNKPMGFYVELDDRNHPFQITPKEATGELAYTAVGEGCHYLNTFIYTSFGTGNMARPERWENGGIHLRAIAETGPFLVVSERPDAKVALYFPYANWILSGKAYYPTFICELVRRAFGECDILHEEIARVRGLNPYRVIVLANVDIIPAEIEAAIIDFIKEGGILILDRVPAQTPEGKALSRLQRIVGEMPQGMVWETKMTIHGTGRIVKVPPDLDGTYRRAVEEDDKYLRTRIENEFGAIFVGFDLLPAARCEDPEFDADLLTVEGGSGLVVVNHRPQSATATVRVFNLSHPVGYVCDLTTGTILPHRSGQGCVEVDVTLTARQGIVIALLPHRPRTPTLNARFKGGSLIMTLGGSDVPVPVFVDVTYPDGRRSARHSYSLLLQGRDVSQSPLAINEPTGKWRVQARCPAVKWKQVVEIEKCS